MLGKNAAQTCHSERSVHSHPRIAARWRGPLAQAIRCAQRSASLGIASAEGGAGYNVGRKK